MTNAITGCLPQIRASFGATSGARFVIQRLRDPRIIAVVLIALALIALYRYVKNKFFPAPAQNNNQVPAPAANPVLPNNQVPAQVNPVVHPSAPPLEKMPTANDKALLSYLTILNEKFSIFLITIENEKNAKNYTAEKEVYSLKLILTQGLSEVIDSKTQSEDSKEFLRNLITRAGRGDVISVLREASNEAMASVTSSPAARTAIAELDQALEEYMKEKNLLIFCSKIPLILKELEKQQNR